MFTHYLPGVSREWGGHSHETVAEARACEGEAEQEQLEAAAELAAERAAERYFEEGPFGSSYVGSEEEAQDRFYDSLAGR